MMNERVKELLDYLNALSQVQGAGHYVNEEIKEAVKEIRIELGLDKIKRDTLKASRYLVFEAKLGRKATFTESMLFEAVFGRKDSIAFTVDLNIDGNLSDALEVIEGMKPERYIEVTPLLAHVDLVEISS
jgi:hypothetical protein